MQFYILITIRKRIFFKIPFIITSKIIKYLEVNLIKEVKDLHSENYNTLMNATENYTTKLKDIP